MEQNLTIVFFILLFIFGLLAGSFLNVLIFKLPRKLPVFKPYSICTSCKTRWPFICNFPVLSRIIFKSGCASCGTKIPVRGIAVELINSFLYILIFYFFGFSIKTLSGLLFCSLLVIITFIDWDFMIIPNVIVLPFTLTGILLQILENPSKWWMPLAFSAGAFTFMLIIHLIYPKGMGMGDVKLALMMGAFLVKNVVAGIFIGFLMGSIAGLVFMIFKKKTLKQFIPFGPFLSGGGAVAFFAGDIITKWYISFF